MVYNKLCWKLRAFQAGVLTKLAETFAGKFSNGLSQKGVLFINLAPCKQSRINEKYARIICVHLVSA